MFDSSETRLLGGPYDCVFFSARFSPQLFEDDARKELFDSSYHHTFCPDSFVPRSPSLSEHSNSSNESLNSLLDIATTTKIGEFRDSSPAGESMQQRTTSVIMKIEHQQVIVLNTHDFDDRTSSDSEDELIICKWKHCYR